MTKRCLLSCAEKCLNQVTAGDETHAPPILNLRAGNSHCRREYPAWQENVGRRQRLEVEVFLGALNLTQAACLLRVMVLGFGYAAGSPGCWGHQHCSSPAAALAVCQFSTLALGTHPAEEVASLDCWTLADVVLPAAPAAAAELASLVVSVAAVVIWTVSAKFPIGWQFAAGMLYRCCCYYWTSAYVC